MKRRLNIRERILLIATLLAVLGLLIYRLGLSSAVESWQSTSETLAQEKSIFNNYLKALSEQEVIKRRYQELGYALPPPVEGQRPEQQFSEQVSSICQRLGFPYPNIEPPKDEEIPGVEEYKFIVLRLKVEGTTLELAKLLKSFDAHSLLIKELTLKGVRDSDQVKAEISVARISKLSEAELQRKKARDKRPRPRPRVTYF